MSSETQTEENQRRVLRALIAETQTSPARYAKELEIFAEAFAHTCGHNRLEQIGLRWSEALSPAQTRLLATDRGLAAGFAAHLHRAVMRHLLPSEDELMTLPRPALAEWAVALRMGIQGVLRRRAYVSGESTGRAAFPQPHETFLRSLQPTITRAADEFFLSVSEARPQAGTEAPGPRGRALAGAR